MTLYQTRHDGGVHAVRICTTREAFKVLTVGKVPVSAVEWQTAFDKLVKALLDPMPRKVEATRFYGSPRRSPCLPTTLAAASIEPTFLCATSRRLAASHSKTKVLSRTAEGDFWDCPRKPPLPANTQGGLSFAGPAVRRCFALNLLVCTLVRNTGPNAPPGPV